MASATELSNINFKQMIGGPLFAVIDAQKEAAAMTLSFVQELMGDDGTLRAATFAYKKQAQEDDKLVEQNVELSVPLLTMVPIPFLRVDYVNIKFNAKLTSVQIAESEKKTDVTVEVSSGWLAKPYVNISGSFSHQARSYDRGEEHKSFSMEVQVHAVQDAMPAGLDRALNILESAIAEKKK
jgi:hypothetical protein